MTPIVEARALTKRFGKVEALAGLDLVVEPGQVVALLGPTARGRRRSSAPSRRCFGPTSGTLRVGGVRRRREAGRRCAGSSASPGSTPRSRER